MEQYATIKVDSHSNWWNDIVTIGSSAYDTSHAITAVDCGISALSVNGHATASVYEPAAPTPALPSITRVRIFNENTVKVEFADKTFTTATTHGDDKFDLETGILICIAKRAFWDKKTGKTTVFSKVHKAVSVYKAGVKAEELKKKAEKEAQEARARKIAKAKAKREKRAKRASHENA